MAYNYSPEFLVKHRDLVAKLVHIAKTGETALYEATNWHAMHNQQYLVLNVMANMSRNLSDYADIRQRLRCWTELRKDGTYCLYVGTPTHNLSGRKPGPVSAGWRENLISTAQVASMVATGDEFAYPDSWTEDNYLKLVGTISDLPPRFRRAKFHVPDLGPDHAEQAKEFFEPPFLNIGWRIVRVENEFIYLERT